MFLETREPDTWTPSLEETPLNYPASLIIFSCLRIFSRVIDIQVVIYPSIYLSIPQRLHAGETLKRKNKSISRTQGFKPMLESVSWCSETSGDCNVSLQQHPGTQTLSSSIKKKLVVNVHFFSQYPNYPRIPKQTGAFSIKRHLSSCQWRLRSYFHVRRNNKPLPELITASSTQCHSLGSASALTHQPGPTQTCQWFYGLGRSSLKVWVCVYVCVLSEPCCFLPAVSEVALRATP